MFRLNFQLYSNQFWTNSVWTPIVFWMSSDRVVYEIQNVFRLNSDSTYVCFLDRLPSEIWKSSEWVLHEFWTSSEWVRNEFWMSLEWDRHEFPNEIRMSSERAPHAQSICRHEFKTISNLAVRVLCWVNLLMDLFCIMVCFGRFPVTGTWRQPIWVFIVTGTWRQPIWCAHIHACICVCIYIYIWVPSKKNLVGKLKRVIFIIFRK